MHPSEGLLRAAALRGATRESIKGAGDRKKNFIRKSAAGLRTVDKMLRSITTHTAPLCRVAGVSSHVRYSSFLGLPVYRDPQAQRFKKSVMSPDPRFPPKISTGVFGLPVIPDAREVYLKQIKKILREIRVNLPPESRFRWLYERTYSFRQKILEAEEDPRVIEKRLNAGQLEELIEEGHNVLAQIPIEVEDKDWIKDPDNPTIFLWSTGNSTI
jgi:hypothetical protein